MDYETELFPKTNWSTPLSQMSDVPDFKSRWEEELPINLYNPNLSCDWLVIISIYMFEDQHK